eukprot:753197-Hanusia_phi.AAC.3
MYQLSNYLVKLLEGLHVHAGDAVLLSLLTVLGISKDADSHVGARNTRKLNSSAEALVLLGIILLQPNLQLHSLTEFPLLLVRLLGDGPDSLTHGLTLKLALQGSMSAIFHSIFLQQ